ncbi:hypothetical protein ACHQM5_000268 [Ranunculus cassubicifolius]
MVFKGGDPVEVKSKEEGSSSMGCYYSATILKPLGKDDYLVQYKTLLEDDKKHLVKEVVDASKIRPMPPRIHVDYRIGDTVDACDGEGWRVGKLIEIRNGKDFGICFGRGDVVDYPGSKVRLRQEWKEGKWFLSREPLTSSTPVGLLNEPSFSGSA